MADQEPDDSTKVWRVPNKASVTAIHLSILFFDECHFESVHSLNRIQDCCAYRGLSFIYLDVYGLHDSSHVSTDYLFIAFFLFIVQCSMSILSALASVGRNNGNHADSISVYLVRSLEL
jgi:hypothetical protein